MDPLIVVNDASLSEHASPKGDDDSVLPAGSGSKLAEQAGKATAITFSSGDPPAMNVEEILQGLKEETEYDENDVGEISLHDIEAGKYARQNIKSGENKTAEPPGKACGKNDCDCDQDCLVVIGGKLVPSGDDAHVTAGHNHGQDDDFDIIDDSDSEGTLNEKIEMLVNSILLAQIQQNDGTVSPEMVKAAKESESDFEIIDIERCSGGGSDAAAESDAVHGSGSDTAVYPDAADHGGGSDTAADPDAVGVDQVVLEWKVISPTDSTCKIETSESDQLADREVETIMAMLAALENQNQVHQGREWRALGPNELAHLQESSYVYEPNNDIDFNNLICQACTRSIELCACGEQEADGNNNKVEQTDEVLQLPQFEVRTPDKLNDSCDGDIEDSCSQTDDSEFKLSRNQRQGEQNPSGVSARPQPSRPMRGGQPTQDKSAKVVSAETHQQREGNKGGHNRSYPARGPKWQHTSETRRPAPRINKRRPNKLPKKQMINLQHAANNGDLFASAKLISHRYKIETEVKDVGFGMEVIMNMSYFRFGNALEQETQAAVGEHKRYWGQELEKERRKLADALADIYAKNDTIKGLTAELDKADEKILERGHLIDQLEEEVKCLREQKRRRNKKQKRRECVETVRPGARNDDSSSRKARDK
jgi:hypothetical protein